MDRQPVVRKVVQDLFVLLESDGLDEVTVGPNSSACFTCGTNNGS